MNMRVTLFLVFGPCHSVLLAALPLNLPVPSIRLKDHLGTEHSIAKSPEVRATVIIVTGVECPLANLYAGRLEELYAEYQKQGVAFYAIDANRQDSLAEIAAHVRQHRLSFPFLKDTQQIALDILKAERTPEVFLLNSQFDLVYRGRIDDQYVPGRSRPQPTVHHLREAIESTLKNQRVAVAETTPVGCLIGRNRPAVAQPKVTFAEHIAPLLNARCVECHRPGEIGPFSLTDYNEVAGWAEMIVEVTREQRMPPWHAAAEFDHQFKNSRRLTPEEIELLSAWSEAGAPAGDLSKLPPAPTFTSGWQLPKNPDLVVAMSEKPYNVIATGEIKYQYFRVDPKLTEDRWVSAIEIQPGNRAVVHHVLVFASTKGQRFDGERGLLGAYVPGLRISPFPQGYAKRIPKGSQLVFQIHYTPNGTAQEDLTRIGFVLADPSEVTHEVRTESVAGKGLRILPELDNQKFSSRVVEAPADLEILSLSPHMHLRGKAFRYELTSVGGGTKTLLDVPAYDFNWQTAYLFEKPLAVRKGSKLQGFAVYDNSKNNLANPDSSQTVRWGDQSYEEMMLGYFDIALPRNETSPANNLTSDTPAENHREAAALLVKSLDKNSDQKLNRTESRNHPLFDQIDTDRDGFVTAEELAPMIPALRKALGGRPLPGE